MVRHSLSAPSQRTYSPGSTAHCRALLLETYRLVNDTKRRLEKLTHLTPQDPRGAALYRSTDKVLRENRERLRAELPKAREALWAAICPTEDESTAHSVVIANCNANRRARGRRDCR